MDKKVIGLGAGGHAKVVIEILRSYGCYELIGLLDPKLDLHGKSILGVTVLGDDDLLPALKREGISHFFIGLGTVGDTSPRRNLFGHAMEYEMIPVDAVHPQAVVSPSAQLGPGVSVMACAVINAGACLGSNVIVNTGAIVEHDCVIGHHVHIASGSRLSGAVHVGDGSHIGAGATALQGIRIAENAIVGAGTTVIRDISSDVTVVGSSMRVLGENR